MGAKNPARQSNADRLATVHQRFTTALAVLVEELKQDRAIVAAILCGSLAHDTVWEKSDIDLLLVTADDRRGERSSVTLNAGGVHVHAQIMPRGGFRTIVEGAVHNSFMHSLVAKGQLLFSSDPTVADLHARLRIIGTRDTQMQLLRAAVSALSSLDKARKWLVTRDDLDYSALWILYAATALARIDIIGRGLLADREVVPQAAALNRPLFDVIYTGLLNTRKTRSGVLLALQAAEGYLRERAPTLFALVLDHLRDAGEARACTEIEAYFARHYDIAEVTTACEYLAAEGLLGKASLPTRLTKRSTVDVQELAFFALEAPSQGGRR